MTTTKDQVITSLNAKGLSISLGPKSGIKNYGAEVFIVSDANGPINKNPWKLSDLLKLDAGMNHAASLEKSKKVKKFTFTFFDKTEVEAYGSNFESAWASVGLPEVSRYALKDFRFEDTSSSEKMIDTVKLMESLPTICLDKYTESPIPEDLHGFYVNVDKLRDSLKSN